MYTSYSHDIILIISNQGLSFPTVYTAVVCYVNV